VIAAVVFAYGCSKKGDSKPGAPSEVVGHVKISGAEHKVVGCAVPGAGLDLRLVLTLDNGDQIDAPIHEARFAVRSGGKEHRYEMKDCTRTSSGGAGATGYFRGTVQLTCAAAGSRPAVDVDLTKLTCGTKPVSNRIDDGKK
jgi:hypothetical protein